MKITFTFLGNSIFTSSQLLKPLPRTFYPIIFIFLIRIRPVAVIESWINSLLKEKQTKTQLHFLSDHNINTFVEMEFKRLFTSYAMAVNKMNNRNGNLFSRTFKRVAILKESQFTQAIIYIHANAQKHQLVKDFTAYPWTSYHSIISNKPTKILREEALEWFGGLEQFIKIHKDMSDYYYDFPGAIEGDE